MSGMPIGALARISGLAPSAIRYYEKAGLPPKPARRSSQCRYETSILGRLRIILVARNAGFEIDALMLRFARMRALLESSFRCECHSIGHCERAIQLNNA